MESVATDCADRNDRWKSLQGVTHFVTRTVAVAQLVERQVVVLDVAGSNPVDRPEAADFRVSSHAFARSIASSKDLLG